MTNKEEGEKLIKEAERIFNRDLKIAWEEKDHNMVVRRAQEAVELALKGALRFLGIDFPKVHDVGFLFVEQSKRKGVYIEKGKLGKIEEISLWLSEARAPSFYLERTYTMEDAHRAFQDAEFVLKEIKAVLKL